MSKLINIFKGKKSYLVAAALFVVAGLQGLGKIDDATAEKLKMFLEGTALFTIRAAIAKGK